MVLDSIGGYFDGMLVVESWMGGPFAIDEKLVRMMARRYSQGYDE